MSFFCCAGFRGPFHAHRLCSHQKPFIQIPATPKIGHICGTLELDAFNVNTKSL